VNHHGADRARVDAGADQSGRSLRELSRIAGPITVEVMTHEHRSATRRAGPSSSRAHRAPAARCVGWPVALALALLAALPAAARVGGRHAAVARGEVGAKLEYCQDCHGPSGQGYYGYYPIPRLAGQQPEYLKNQLQAFIEHRRTNNIMFNVAHSLSPGLLSALAARFSAFDPPPIGGAPRGSVSLGRTIFEDGLPEANIAACA